VSFSLCFWVHSACFYLWTGVRIDVQRGSAFLHPRSARCLEIAEWETFIPISSSLAAKDPEEIAGCL